LYPPAPSMRIVAGIIAYTSRHMPRFNSISISGYHMQEAGATCDQELAFTLADGLEYVRAALSRGLDIDQFAGRLSFFFAIGMSFFMEVAKLRAARLLWATLVKRHFARKALATIDEVEKLGGMTRAIESGMPKLRIEESSARRQARVDRGEDVIVGVNKFQPAEEPTLDIREIDNTAVREAQVARLKRIRASRDATRVGASLEALTRAAETGSGNLLEL